MSETTEKANGKEFYVEGGFFTGGWDHDLVGPVDAETAAEARRQGYRVSDTLDDEQKVYILFREIDSEVVGVYATFDLAWKAASPKRGKHVPPRVTEALDKGVARVEAGSYTFVVWEMPVITHRPGAR